MSCKSWNAGNGLGDIMVVCPLMHRQVEEVLQEVELVLRSIGCAVTIVDVNLRIALAVSILMVEVHVVPLILHHLVEVVVVGHRELYGVRIGLAKVGLGVVRYPIAVLIPVHRCAVVDIGLSVLVCGSILIVGEYFPTGAEDFISTRSDVRNLQTYCR